MSGQGCNELGAGLRSLQGFWMLGKTRGLEAPLALLKA